MKSVQAWRGTSCTEPYSPHTTTRTQYDVGHSCTAAWIILVAIAVRTWQWVI